VYGFLVWRDRLSWRQESSEADLAVKFAGKEAMLQAG
jgi:hypothetical protein